jgi:hypothetical protein
MSAGIIVWGAKIKANEKHTEVNIGHKRGKISSSEVRQGENIVIVMIYVVYTLLSKRAQALTVGRREGCALGRNVTKPEKNIAHCVVNRVTECSKYWPVLENKH